MTMLKMFGTLIAFAGAVGLFAPAASAVDFDAGIFHGGLARQVLEQQDAERHRAERPRYGLYEQDGYGRHSESERVLRKAQREAAAAAASRRARAAHVEAAQTAATAATAKLDGKLPSDPAPTTEIPETSNETTTTAGMADTSASDSKTDLTTGSPPDGKHVCRRYSPEIAALVDVPCE
jgi:hypothetical protein